MIRPALALLLTALIVLAQDETPARKTDLVLRKGLAVAQVGRYGRSPMHIDPIAAAIAAGTWAAPKAGDTIAGADGMKQTWEAIEAGKDGMFTHPALAGGYAYFAVPSESERVMILAASGHAMAYVNGEPRAGDGYSHDYVRLPVLLHKGTNHLLFHAARGNLKVQLAEPAGAAELNPRDALLPDLLVGQPARVEAAIPVVNAGREPQKDLVLAARTDDGAGSMTPVPIIPPLGMRKVGFSITAPAPTAEGKVPVEVTLLLREGEKLRALDRAKLEVRAVDPAKAHKRTFRSRIDDSLQYYAVVPAKPNPGDARPGLTLTLHGAAVEAIGQAQCYAAKPWTHIVAPTNRRPFGFDWEDWGRLDAIEVLEHAQKELQSEPRRTYLTGHSMGGHGTWHLGATYPDRFAAIGPSAGWVSMASYTGVVKEDGKTPVRELILRCANPGDTLALARNCAAEAVYILHGAQDDNVPVTHARTMKKTLEAFHKDIRYHEQEGAGHWWGNECVDWRPMFEMFRRHQLPAPAEVHDVHFITASPGVSARMHWAVIERQEKAGKFSTVELHLGADPPRLSGKTANVARLAIDVGHLTPAATVAVELDGQKLPDVAWPKDNARFWLERRGGQWIADGPAPPGHKYPERYGPLRDAFRNHMAFVYGTGGTPEENAWALAKARYDAETFWYRGNGAVDVLADTSFDPAADPNRNIILYGNAQTNKAWKALLADSPVQVTAGHITVGERGLDGADLACLFLRPRPGSALATVGVVAGTGPHGMRLTDRLPLFISGVGYPDCLVFGPEALAHGLAGVRGAGFFGPDWGVKTGEFAWR